MLSHYRKLAGTLYLTLTGAPQRARRDLYHGAHGLRILTFHDVPPHDFDTFRRIIDVAQESFDVVGPTAPAALTAGQAPRLTRDQILFAFDDGFQSNYAAAQYLHDQNIHATFFIVPSFLDRTLDEFVAFHGRQNVKAFRFLSRGTEQGLARTQAREMHAMGHLVAAHNYAHRDLAELTTPADLEYEIDRALDEVAELTGAPCNDFAIGFGRPRHVSAEAVAHLKLRCQRTYACVRGLNIPGQSPNFLLRDNAEFDDPMLFHKFCLRAGADQIWKPEVEELRQLSGTLPAR